MAEKTRTCKSCGETKPIEDFPVTSKKSGYRRKSCRTCYNAIKRGDMPKPKRSKTKTRKAKLNVGKPLSGMPQTFVFVDQGKGTYKLCQVVTASERRLEEGTISYFLESGFRVFEVNNAD